MQTRLSDLTPIQQRRDRAGAGISVCRSRGGKLVCGGAVGDEEESVLAHQNE